ncbi:MAG: hypothetical protein L6Q95_13065 [Planctomycetes bacterium]|nr:hypothetical protein [Planctomycetota bacterium]
MANTLDQIRKEMGEWEAKLQRLRVKADLSRMELRDLVTKAETKFRAVRESLANAADEGAARAGSAAAGTKAAWASFKDAYHAAMEKHRDG